MPMSSGTPDLVRHCVAAVADKYDGDTSKAFAICVAQLQKAGYLKPGTMELTAAGKQKEKEHEAEPDAEKKMRAYEKLLKANRKEESYAAEAKGFQCLECGKKFKRPVDECPKCGGSDIDLAESAEDARDDYHGFFERLANPAVASGFEGVPTTVARRYESITKAESGLDAMRRLAGIAGRYDDRSMVEAAPGIVKGDKGYEATPENVAALLANLKVNAGGKPGFVDLTKDKNFTVSMREAERDAGYPYVMVLDYFFKGTRQTRKVPLQKADVMSKSKGTWARDKVWRLTDEATKRFAEQLAKMLTDPRATQSEKAESVQSHSVRKETRMAQMRRLAGIVTEAADAMAALATALKDQWLPTSGKDMRRAAVKEFMLMSPEPVKGKWQFKHGPSRNYLYLDVKSGEISIPKSNEPFMRGTFDA